MLDEPGHPPTLNYAGKLVVGSDYWRQHVDAMIESGCAPEELRRYFKRPGEAAVYYGEAMSRRYSGVVDAPCLLCQTSPALRVMRITWVVRLNRLFLRPVGEAYFTTHHRVCDGCAQHGRRRMHLDRWWEGVAVLASFASAIILVFFSLEMAKAWSMDSPELILINFLAWSFLSAMNLSMQARSRMRWRDKVQPLMQDGVSFAGVVGFSTAKKGDD